MIIAFAEPKRVDWAAGKSWLAASLSAWGVEVIVVELQESVRSEILTARLDVEDVRVDVDERAWESKG